MSEQNEDADIFESLVSGIEPEPLTEPIFRSIFTLSVDETIVLNRAVEGVREGKPGSMADLVLFAAAVLPAGSESKKLARAMTASELLLAVDAHFAEERKQHGMQ